jgi:hypothetical protein
VLRKDPEERSRITDILQSSVISGQSPTAPAELPRTETETSQFYRNESPLHKTIAQRRSQDDILRTVSSSEVNDLDDSIADQDFIQQSAEMTELPRLNSLMTTPQTLSRTFKVNMPTFHHLTRLYTAPSMDLKAYESKVASKATEKETRVGTCQVDHLRELRQAQTSLVLVYLPCLVLERCL